MIKLIFVFYKLINSIAKKTKVALHNFLNLFTNNVSKITTNPINIPIDSIILINGSILLSISSFYDYLVDNLIIPTYFGKIKVY